MADQHIIAAFDDHVAMRALVETCDVTTFEIESIDTQELIKLEADGYAIYPSPALLAQIQDKLTQKQLLLAADIPTAEFVDATELSVEAFAAFGFPLVQKARRGGYDGRGVAVIKTADDFNKHLPVPSYIERFIPASKELSVLVARGRKGEMVSYPLVEMLVHAEQNVLDLVLAPANVSVQIAQQAQEIAQRAIEALDGVGLFGVELFLTENEQILVNEIAPRTHNSGHHTIEANATDQFEQHLRAVMGLPLGSVAQLSPAAMLNLLGAPEHSGAVQVSGLNAAMEIDGVTVHLYGKEKSSPYRKMGHVTILDKNLSNAEQKARKVQKLLTISGEKKHG